MKSISQHRPPRQVRLALLLSLYALWLSACVTPVPAALERYEYSRPEMGMPFRMVIHAETEPRPRKLPTMRLRASVSSTISSQITIWTVS
jgi:hypothetical protein